MNRYTLFFAVASLILAAALFRSCEQVESREALISGLNKNLRIQEIENGRKQTTINLLQASRKDLLNLPAGGDTALQHLQAVVKKDKNIVAATVFNAITEGKASGAIVPAQSVVPSTTPARRDSLKLFAIVKAPGFEAEVEARADSIRLLKYKIFAGYEITQTSEPQGFLKPRLQVVRITPTDPGGTVVDARSFTVQQPRQRTGLKILAGAIAGGLAYKYGAKVFKAR